MYCCVHFVEKKQLSSENSVHEKYLFIFQFSSFVFPKLHIYFLYRRGVGAINVHRIHLMILVASGSAVNVIVRYRFTYVHFLYRGGGGDKTPFLLKKRPTSSSSQVGQN